MSSRTSCCVGLILWVVVSAGLCAQVPRYTDEGLDRLPIDIQELRMRGSSGYGTDQVSDAGIEKLTKCRHLRILHAGGLGLTDRCLKAIGELSELEELSLDGNKLSGTELQHLTRLKKLKRLNLSFNPLQPGWNEIVAELPTLTELRIVEYQHPLDDAICSSLCKLENLTALDLNDDAREVTDNGVIALSKLKQLTSIRLKSAQITRKGLATLAELKQLTVLRLSHLPSIEPGSLAGLPQLTKLRELELDAVALNRDDLAAINGLASLESLLLWNIRWASIDQSMIQELSGLKSLRAIRTNERIAREALLDLSRISTIESITDGLTEVSDHELFQLAKLPKLQILVLDSPLVTSQSLDALKMMKSLRFLCVSEKVKLCADQLTNLGRESLHNCKIVSRTGDTVYYEPPAP